MTKIKEGLVVSCQALKDEPLYGGNTIAKMALAAKQGGAVGIRANTVKDINAIYKYIDGEIPIIGLIKRCYADSPIYITPTMTEVKALINSKCSVIALDATARIRPKNTKLGDLVRYIRDNSDKPIMADIATYDEAMEADRLGFDYISTTMRGYTEDTVHVATPDIDFCKKLRYGVKNAVVCAEGGIHTFEEVRDILESGLTHIIIGGAITRPQNITKNYVDVIQTYQREKLCVQSEVCG